MVIDERKVNLAEADIEQWLWENPSAVEVNMWGEMRPIVAWIGRQLAVPSGIIDLLGRTDDGTVAVVEVKNGPIQAAALTQAKRYSYDVVRILEKTKEQSGYRYNPPVFAIVVGKHFENVVLREAEAVRVQVVTFAVDLRLHVQTRIAWSDSFEEKRGAEWTDLASLDTFVEAVAHYSDYEYTEEEERSDSEYATDEEEIDFVI